MPHKYMDAHSIILMHISLQRILLMKKNSFWAHNKVILNTGGEKKHKAIPYTFCTSLYISISSTEIT